MSLLASLIGGCQSFGGFTTCFPSVTNHSKRGHPAETDASNQLKTSRTAQTIRANTRTEHGCTFKCCNLPCLCFGQALLTGICGQCQRDAAAAQQKANLLTSCVLTKQTGWGIKVWTFKQFGKSTVEKNTIQVMEKKRSSEEMGNCKSYHILNQSNSR